MNFQFTNYVGECNYFFEGLYSKNGIHTFYIRPFVASIPPFSMTKLPGAKSPLQWEINNKEQLSASILNHESIFSQLIANRIADLLYTDSFE